MREIRSLSLAEVELLLGWAALEGWNPGIGDAPAFRAADPNGFRGAFVGSTMVAAIAAVAYDAYFGFIGLYICHPDWRGQGHGKAVWDAGIAYLGDRTIGLDGVPEQQANYASMGFVPAYETIRMSGTLRSDQTSDHQIPPVATLEEIRDLDRQCFPARRDDFLKAWLAPPNRSLVHRVGGVVDGYVVLRPCHIGAKIGPLFAHDISVAIDLLATLSGPVQIDVPAAQTDWLEALAARGLQGGSRTKRMYRGALPTTGLDRVFGVSSLELG